ncbi:unnamed protein product [Ixodes pacificus]
MEGVRRPNKRQTEASVARTDKARRLGAEPFVVCVQPTLNPVHSRRDELMGGKSSSQMQSQLCFPSVVSMHTVVSITGPGSAISRHKLYLNV